VQCKNRLKCNDSNTDASIDDGTMSDNDEGSLEDAEGLEITFKKQLYNYYPID
jgi:hypothetical protein